MDVFLFTCAQGASIDVRTSVLSIFQIFEEIQVASVPAIIPSITLVTALSRTPDEDEDTRSRIKIFLDTEQLIEFPLQTSFQGKLRTRDVSVLNGLIIPRIGRVLSVRVFLNDEQKGIWDIPITTIAPQVVTQVVAPPAAH
jgi:hypothetical protein